MGKVLNLEGLGAQVILFFARNPEEELNTLDIALKFDVPAPRVRMLLRHVLADDAIEQVKSGGGPGNHAVYRAGPRLLKVLGLASLACVPVGSLAAVPEKL